jgi:N-acetylglutamate synthase-like GNAT family acetyltransferase
MVRGAGLNPLNLQWQRFLIVEDGGRMVGAGQVRRHPGNVAELASLVVDLDYRGRGIGDALVYALMDREQGPVWLMCQNQMAGYYARFGFTVAAHAAIPSGLRRWQRLGNLMATLASRFGHDPFYIVVMVATAPLPAPGRRSAAAQTAFQK